MYVHGDVNLDVLKKNLLIHLGLLIVYGTVPALCSVLSATHSPDFIYFLELIVAVDVVDPLFELPYLLS